ncbi:MAG: bacterial Ig-like domain-containing protein [Treponema sp.]|nr:bacterial Ig-like domain-containing protein [Treponema sp.]
MVSISIRSLPAKLQYTKGEDFDRTGLVVEGRYGDGTTHSEESYSLTRDLTDTLGEKTVTVSLNKLTASFTITVTEPVLVSITISKLPNKLNYAQGEAFDPAGLRVIGTYTDKTSKEETGYTLSSVDTSSTGRKTVSLTLKGFTARFTITVGEAALASIAVSRLPDKTVYTKGEAFDPTGLKITGTYTNGTTKEETGYTLGAVDMQSTGQKEVRVSLRAKSTTFTITVNPALLASIGVSKAPVKTVYKRGTAFDAAGLEVSGTYTDHSVKRETGYTLSAVDTNTPGIKTVTVSLQGRSTAFSIAVMDPALYFDYGRRHSPEESAGVGRYSVPAGRTLLLAPVRWYISDNASYTWQVDGATQAAAGEYFSFTPTEQKTYTITVSAEGITAQTTVECVAPEGTYLRNKTGTSKARVSTCFEFTPAPGQFVSISPAATEASVRAEAQAAVDSNTGSTHYVWSLGAWGGYVVTGFDHSVLKSGGYDLEIHGNPLGGWSEPGTVWVMQDENGNGQPDDTWYELKGSETGKAAAKQRYGLTYYKPDGIHELLWIDNMHTLGSLSAKNYYGEVQGYPHSVSGDRLTFIGTRLPQTLENGTIITNPGFPWSYVDNEGDPYFKISDAIQADGSAAALAYIDFVKVQTAVNMYAGSLGEVSSETGLPFDYSMTH